MTSPETLLSLAAKVEAAEGPDRALDALIRTFVSADEVWIVGHKPGRFPQEAIYGTIADYREWASRLLDENAPPHERESLAGAIATPLFTASIDAALTLVPEGMEWELYCYDPRRDPRFGRYQARIPLESMDEDPDETGPQAIANGNSAALALCSAALKARAAEGSAPNE